MTIELTPIPSLSGPVVLREAGAEDVAAIVAILQLSFLPGLARRGALRAVIEAVRVAGTERWYGTGEALTRSAIEESRRRGCALVQPPATSAGPGPTASTTGSGS